MWYMCYTFMVFIFQKPEEIGLVPKESSEVNVSTAGENYLQLHLNTEQLLPVLLDIRVTQFAIGDDVCGLGDCAVSLGQLLVSVYHTMGCVDH